MSEDWVGKEVKFVPGPVPISIVCSGCRQVMSVAPGAANMNGRIFITVIPCTCGEEERSA